MPNSSTPLPYPPAPVPFWTAFRFWLKLGFISFGGPAGQIAIMHREVVDRRRWVPERRFLHALNYCMVLPGPEATQLAIFLGWLLHGPLGGVVAGALFVLPASVLLLGLSWLYVTHGTVPAVAGLFFGMKTAVVAVVGAALLRLGRRALKTRGAVALALGAFVALRFFQVPFPLLILGAGLLGFVAARRPSPALPAAAAAEAAAADFPPLPHHRPTVGRWLAQLAVGLLCWALPMAGLGAWQGWDGALTEISRFFTLMALVTFGGAYAVIPYVARQAVDVYGWLLPGEMTDGLALGETTPGPLILVLTFVGFVGGWRRGGLDPWAGLAGGAVATYFTFLPSFVFVILGAPFVERLRGHARLDAALAAVTAAVVGVILDLAVLLGRQVLFPGPGWGADPVALVLSGAALLLLVRYEVSVVAVVLGCGVVGLLGRGWG